MSNDTYLTYLGEVKSIVSAIDRETKDGQKSVQTRTFHNKSEFKMNKKCQIGIDDHV